MQWRCMKRLLFSHFVIQAPMIALTKLFLDLMGMSIAAPLPSWSTIGAVIFGCIVVEDFYFYWIHRALHWGWLYQKIHKVHHEHTAPFGIAAEYAHPVETAILGLGTILGPLLFCNHLLTLWAWLIVRLFQTIEVHSGYNFPWSLNRYVPLWGGAVFHDYHHEVFLGNYASTFTLWDWVFGTDVKYRKRQASLAAGIDASVDVEGTATDGGGGGGGGASQSTSEPTTPTDISPARRSLRLRERKA